MKIDELVVLLLSFPEETEVFYEDPLYGGVLQEVVNSDFQFVEDQLLIRVPFAHFEED